MKLKTKILMGTAALALVGIAFATPILKLTIPILAMGTHNNPMSATGDYPVDGGYFKVALTTNRPASVVTQLGAFNVGGENGWHSHPGMVAVTLTAGQIAWYDENCHETIYSAGDTWFEGSQIHMFKNIGQTNVQLTAVFIVSQGAPLRLDQSAPACATALGLN
ncbi:MAG: hypothetical protein JOZ17_19245 [Acetobacteraceae bacterium]|nr:hypothetical protein [Acetobacteraceae bacterium]